MGFLSKLFNKDQPKKDPSDKGLVPRSSGEGRARHPSSEGPHSPNESQVPHTADEGRVWIFAEPYSESLDSTWDTLNFIPPKDLVAAADKEMEFGGRLIEFVGESYAVEKAPRMTDAEAREFIRKRVGGAKWLHFSVNSELIKYHVVVVFPVRG